jgi:cyanate permease
MRRRLGEEQAVAVLVGGMFAGLVIRALARDRALFTGTIVAGFAVAVLNVLIRAPSSTASRDGSAR